MAGRASIGGGALRGLLAVLALGGAQATAQASLAALVRQADDLGVTTGVLVRDLGGDRPLFAHRALTPFAPASNMKVLTAVAVEVGLGAEYRFRTGFQLRGGVLHVRAGGDPSWRTGSAQDPAVILRAAVEPLRAAGIRRIRGIALDEGSFTGPRRPASWPRDQLDRYYCAPTGGLVLDEGCFRVQIRATSSNLAQVTLLGPESGVPFTGSIAMTRSQGEGSLYGVRDHGGRLHLFGRFYSRAAPALVIGTVRDPTSWFLKTLEQALTEAGIRIDPQAPEQSLPAHVHESPLRPVLRRALVHSSNFAAEQCLRVLGAELLDDGSLAGGIRAMERELGRLVGNLPDSTRLVDGSGLSRDNQITPALVLEVLLVAVSLGFEAVELLPQVGDEGTLSARFGGSPVAARVRAKTGWIAGASALSGVLELESRQQRLFSILMSYDPKPGAVNNRQLKKLQERMVEAMDRLPAADRFALPANSHEPVP